MSVYIAAYHQSAFGKLYDMPLEQMLGRAALGALEACGANPDVVDTASVAGVCAPVLNRQMLLAGLLAQAPGFAGKPIDTAENACASGGQAVLNVVHRLLAGVADVGLAVGVEKMRSDDGKMDGALIGETLGVASHPSDREGKRFVFPHLFAELMQRYMDAHGVTELDLAHVSATAYAHAQHNPLAHMHQRRFGVEDIMRVEGVNRYLAPGLPLKTLECSQVSDGYAALVLCNDAGLAKLGVPKARAVRIAGFAQRTDPLTTKGREEAMLRPPGPRAAVRAAFEMAGIGADDLLTAEVHDCFGIAGAMATEMLGLSPEGQGARYWAEGRAHVGGGAVPINTSGGLIAKGHPIGATGVSMLGWGYRQLVGDVPEPLQVRAEGREHVATFNIGGPLTATVATVLCPAA